MSEADRVGQQLNDYLLLEKESFGGIYLAEHKSLGTRVAIKILPTQSTGTERDFFIREAQIMMSLMHPHIVQVYHFGIVNDTPYIVMEYAAQGSLRQRYPKGTQVPLSVIITYVKQLADALQYVHSQELVHLDIKPENILVQSDSEIILADFGIATTFRTHSTDEQKVAGTIAYMAPEQILGKPTKASDQYALGIVVYEWLCGTLPFLGSFAEVGQQHLYAPPPSFQEQGVEIAPSVEAVVRKALAKKPEDRFANVQEFASALEWASQNISGPLPSESQEIRVVPTVLGDPSLLQWARSSLNYAVGRVLSIFSFNKQALRAYEQAILLESSRSQFYVGKGEVLINLKRYREALAAFDEAIRLAPESSKAYRGRGRTYEQIAQQSYDEFKRHAQQSYEKAKELGVE